MEIQLTKATLDDAQRIWRMQVEAFMPLLERYQDVDTNPASEPIDKVVMRLKQPYTYYYLIQVCEETVGAIRVVDKQEEGKNKPRWAIFLIVSIRNSFRSNLRVLRNVL